MDYTVQQGDCMSSIAFENGFLWKTLWSLPENAALKAKRKNPNVLMPGDVVYIPDLRVKQEPRPTDARHQFVKRGVPEKLHVRLLDYNHEPRPNVDYIIVIDGVLRKGKTDGSGRITEPIAPNAKKAKLTYPAPQAVDGTDKPIPAKLTYPAPQHVAGTGKPIPAKPKNQVMTLQLGHLNPISVVSGLKARLANLGFYKGPIDENLDDKTKAAISAFQAKQGIPVTGDADDATQQQMQKLHGH
jgi:Putative peptidoglycan binding domain/LysM domain